MASNQTSPEGVGNIVIISAPSGSGKSTLVRRLLASTRGLEFSISYTTRRPRAHEREGRDYFFITVAQFKRMIAAREFVEWANVYGHYYGTPRRQLVEARQAGKDILLDIDVQGHRKVRRQLPEAISIFLLPPSFQELRRRLMRRHSDAPQTIEKRLAAAREEIRHWPEYDYIVVNDHVRQATGALRSILAAARFRQTNQQEKIRQILKTFGG